MRISRTSAPVLMKWLPRRELSESMNDNVYGSYGCPRPFCALLDRTSPPGMVIPELAPCPAMPKFATDPVRLMVAADRSAPPLGSAALMRVGAPLYPSLNSFVVRSERMPWRLKTALLGLASV